NSALTRAISSSCSAEGGPEEEEAPGSLRCARARSARCIKNNVRGTVSRNLVLNLLNIICLPGVGSCPPAELSRRSPHPGAPGDLSLARTYGSAFRGVGEQRIQEDDRK